ncbi:MAG: pyroglutamyl-peptidase I [Clostridia bacterium]|nr:pyroglutamyl-peptidase I [Clostridia bacterium]
MKSLVLSAFEPFGNDDINSSAIVMDMIPDVCKTVSITKVVLPVVYKTAWAVLTEAIQRVKPDFVLCMGQAGGRSKISLETIAVNINNSESPDNQGQILKDNTIITGGEIAYSSGLPVFRMLAACDTELAVASYSAGTFVCNDLFYRMLYDEQNGTKESKTGFVHLPYTEHFGRIPFIASNKQVETIIAMISALED